MAFGFILTGLPLAIGIAILRYRLWDIDLIIRRTLIYSILTAALAACYFASVLFFQAVTRWLTGQENPSQLILVLSTLGIAALFSPLRRAIQDFIDRRFYRRRYDADQTLQGFSASLREDMDLELVSRHLIAVVQDTMQPDQATLWIRKVEE